MEHYTNIFYFNNLNKIGGIETFFYQLSKKYDDNDITIFIKTGDKKQIERLKEHVRVKYYNDEKIKCKKAFFNFNLDVIDNIEADEYIQILHGDYKAMKIKPNINPKINRYLGVSQVVCDSFKELTGIEAELIYNPISTEEPKKVLFLISATRLTNDKGKDRIIKLGELLEKSNIPYLWLIFTDDNKVINNPNIVYMNPTLDISNYIAKADYLIQLSDAEGYCYSVVESLMLNTPVIVTDMPVMREIGVNEENGFILDFDLSNVDINEIYNKQFNFTYKPKEDTWNKEIIKSKSIYKEELRMRYLVEALPIWKEKGITKAEDGVIPNEGEQWEVDKGRFDVLMGENIHKVPFVKLVKEINETPTEKTDPIKVEKKNIKKTNEQKTVKKSTTNKAK